VRRVSDTVTANTARLLPSSRRISGLQRRYRSVCVCVNVFCVILPSQAVGRKFYMYFLAIGNPSTFLNH